jgi:dUTP pyrophosphatase
MKRMFEIVSNDLRRTNADEIILPKRATSRSAGYDIYVPEDVIIEPGKPVIVWTDVKVSMLEDEVFLIFIRSSIGKKMVVLANGTGVIDADYYGNKDNDGNIGIMLLNLGKEPFYIKKGDRVAQGVFVKYMTVENEEEHGQTRKGGFGSTKK